MVRALYTAASGMTAQQTAVDVISNNLANTNTTAYKSQTAQFKTLLYQTLQTTSTSANGDTNPVGAQVGLGTRTSAITTSFEQGSLEETDEMTDFAIDGDGFFAVMGDDGETYYTRDGSFQWALSSEGNLMLCTSEGYPVLDSTGETIELDSDDYVSSSVVIDSDGTLTYPDDDGNYQSLDITIGLFQFSNPSGLEKESSSLYSVTDASGEAINEAESDDITPSSVYQGYLEASNVQIVDEMVNLIIAQRAYEMNSKAVQAADDMMQQANNLRS